ncbi:helix-turn-helix transcriptional regulator [Actinomadura kijaniata]|uniref:Transcriptional regulator with XRE-family HTH domain n=1 Tax=Actinomadura namibiensis TaxID=182080 RepID=A0A7W3LID3_ACTNM|nr:helix-turn-helix transcriptional regulator [Actinomadura namibiensis]MBA8948723.1 transcriptional regulator with XRE-family HTH domain [Actinomadura namibiensis]
MSARDSLDPSESLWDLIAVQLRRHREERNLSGAALARILDLDRSSVSRLESGGMRLQPRHAKLLDQEWKTDWLFTCLVGFARSGHNAEWFKANLEAEARASEVRIWELAWIPGLFQTEAYMRAVFESAGWENVDEHIAYRTKRQALLGRKPRPAMRVILDQGTLDQPVGGPEVMREQLSALLEHAEHPKTTFRVVPRSAGAHIGRDGSFKIMTTGNSEVVYTEATGGGRLVTDPAEVRLFRQRFDRISDHALPVDASTELIKRIMEAFH